jgi:naphthoate synthase
LITVREFEDITYKSNGVARIAFNRPNVRNAFRPKTTTELYQAFMMLKKTSIGVVLLSAEGPSTKDRYTHFVAVEIKMLAGIKVT